MGNLVFGSVRRVHLVFSASARSNNADKKYVYTYIYIYIYIYVYVYVYVYILPFISTLLRLSL